jgi:hypothetical protein
MKSRMLVMAALLAIVTGSFGADSIEAGEISPGSLSKMGLAGVQKMSDREGKQVRGTGSFAVISGFAFALGSTPQGYFNIGNGANSASASHTLGSITVGSFGGSAAFAH